MGHKILTLLKINGLLNGRPDKGYGSLTNNRFIFSFHIKKNTAQPKIACKANIFIDINSDLLKYFHAEKIILHIEYLNC